ncbi:coproporphyrinogen dehydrogenase HemZ [Helicovermis profundi]|uniref:Coproporphyrinogen III oxidase n=1 Tax=Helicovermis profundi TaxID=3065157 RepID=A0AAU9EM17_9FIRM|nr:coproporphyrinogen III oxidase [Clostridia bacterium S502]
MIKIYTFGFDYAYDIIHLVKIFCSEKEIEVLREKDREKYINDAEYKNLINQVNLTSKINLNIDKDLDINIIIRLEDIDGKKRVSLFFFYGINLFNISRKELKNTSIKNIVKVLLYDVFSINFKTSSPWGILVGIRPVKIVHELFDKGYEENEVDDILYEEYRVSKDKRQLIIKTAKNERRFLYPIDKKKISIYICIPFCRTRCTYCSFPSNSSIKKSKLISPYVKALILELESMLKYLNSREFDIDCLYIGGGTPTTLSAEQLEEIFLKLQEYIDLKKLKEFTVEAGRPDTINKEKFKVMKKYFVNRVCINPQTMNDETLKKIGRDHTSSDIVNVFNLAREFEFESINMDLIAGLTDEDENDFKNTLDLIMRLRPENITVHTLAIKRASYLNENKENQILTDSEIVKNMLSLSKSYTEDNLYFPYYLYRQKNMLGNFENIGYSLKGHESLYNMRIMEERHTIVGVGAGSASKFCYPLENRFERFNNIKGLEEYILRFDELVKKKIDLLDQI